MKKEEQMRAEFESWWDKQQVPPPDAYFEYDCAYKQCGYEAWQARQPEIDAKDAEIARLREALLEIAGMDVDFRATIIATKALNGENHE